MIKTWQQRCEEHPDHQQGIVTQQMIQDRMQEEIDELRKALAQPVDAVNMSQERVDETAKGEHEPFIYVREDNERPFGGYEHCSEADAGAFPVYTAPPKREWVGLTDEEIEECKINGGLPHAINWRLSVKVMEAKLKEKNGG